MRIALTGHRPQRLFGEDLDNEKWQAIKHWIQKFYWKIIAQLLTPVWHRVVICCLHWQLKN